MYKSSPVLALLLATAAYSQPARLQVPTQASGTARADSLAVLRARYLVELERLIPRLDSAERERAVADSIGALGLPGDTVVIGALRWLVDESRTPRVREALSRAWSDVHRVFGNETRVLHGHLFAARLRPDGSRDTAQRVIDFAEVLPGRLDVFDRVRENEPVEGVATRIGTRAARIILDAGDTAVMLWLGTPFNPEPLRQGNRERMYTDLVTSPSQVASRCLAGDIARCRDALGLVPAEDPLTQWYDAPERRLLVMRQRDHLANGPQRGQYDECVTRHAYATCDRILRSIPRYAAPPPLPPSARHHLFRLAINSGGVDAYSRLVAARTASVEQRLAAAAHLPVDSVVAQWRADLIAARPPSTVPSLLTVWTTVGWGIAVMLLALRFLPWK